MFDFNFDDIFTPILLDWDKKNYRFNRGEKDMHPYSISSDEEKTIIVHNALGINKEDLKVTKEKENGTTYIAIEGKTEDSLTKREYSVSSRFVLNEEELDLSNIKSSMRNGLLYIIIPTKKPEEPTKDTIENL